MFELVHITNVTFLKYFNNYLNKYYLNTSFIKEKDRLNYFNILNCYIF